VKKLVIYEERCKNCLYCVINCPRKALSVDKKSMNTKGYPPVQVDNSSCILCGVCFSVCPDYAFEIKEVE